MYHLSSNGGTTSTAPNGNIVAPHRNVLAGSRDIPDVPICARRN